jgi:hypothetical protein
VRKSVQLGKIMRPVQKTSRFAWLYDQHDHTPQPRLLLYHSRFHAPYGSKPVVTARTVYAAAEAAESTQNPGAQS